MRKTGSILVSNSGAWEKKHRANRQKCKNSYAYGNIRGNLKGEKDYEKRKETYKENTKHCTDSCLNGRTNAR